MVGCKGGHPFVEKRIEFLAHTAHAGTDSRTRTASRSEIDAAYAIFNQLAEQFSAVHIAVAEREKEAVADFGADVAVINYMEAVTKEYILHSARPQRIFASVGDKVEAAVAGEFEHTRISELGGIRTAARNHIKN